jgi:DNA-binding transcriptional regulator YdaS (Cro superfamily)
VPKSFNEPKKRKAVRYVDRVPVVPQPHVKKLIEATMLVGSQSKLARAVRRLGGSPDLSQQGISHWIAKRTGCPASAAIYVAAATDWQITPHELCPDAFPEWVDVIPALKGIEG